MSIFGKVVKMAIYKKAKNFIENAGIRLEIVKNKYSERKAMRKQSALYKDIQWTEDQKAAFDGYWKKAYGKTIPDSWHKLYQKGSGVFRVDYFPEHIFSEELEWRINPEKYSYVLSDKNLLLPLFGNVSGLHIPRSFLCCCNGVYLDGNDRVATRNRAEDILASVGRAVIKPTVDACSGSDVCVIDMQNGVDSKSGRSVKELLSKYGKNFVVQEQIAPCKELGSLAPNCLCTMRVISYLTDNGVFTCPIMLRIGLGNSEVDNVHSGGLAIAVDDQGHLSKYAYKIGYGDSLEKCSEHPDSRAVFEQYVIPGVPNVIEMAKKLHQRIPFLGMLSWDFTVDCNETVTLIELNTRDQSIRTLQTISGRCLFGDNTEYMLKQIRRERE